LEVETAMQIPRFGTIFFLLVSLGAALDAGAEVVDATAGGFTTRISVDIDAPRQDVYRALINVGRWWNDDHTVSGFASNLSIDPRPLGCFCENLGDGAGLVHMTVTFVNPNVMLRLTGGLGPLGLLGVNGNMTFEIDESEGASTVVLQYAVGGYMDGGLDQIAPAVDGVLIEALNRLRNFVEASK
jgi:uncharacterized protein YndB with AHSA1/START domain